MIRNFTNNDMNEIIDIYTRENKPTYEEIENIRNSKQILVYDEDGIKGFIHMNVYENKCDFEMGISSEEHIKSIGSQLWAEAKKRMEGNSVTSINTCHIKNGIWEGFFDEIGFDYWFSYYKLKYISGKYKEPELDVKKYEDEYYMQEISLESEAFSKLRAENDITPHNWYLSASKDTLAHHRKERLIDKDNFYLFFKEGEMIGAAIIANAEIPLFFVNSKYQGEGYGRKILEFAVNRGLEQDPNGVDLEVLASNEKALQLYTSTGFEIIQGYVNRRLQIV
ncbi:GNAT family N-acetyltransferase [Paenibacillus donghaensis]|uniref:N-acetyltransferase domain-containing protein n=1 Tax=Paenibacillus donghaensis TaxID=414771 RepID=A0A2Z2K4A5_9BACL|nr:GNAT family N-acetyltransferase [Paenibacillus donghaensis]ASA20576.1 hypothetical protein B9T62_07065 [Paenibacillus donghaensis]